MSWRNTFIKSGGKRILYVGDDDVMAQRMTNFARKHPELLRGCHKVDVMHDDWCPRLNGSLHCSCSPEFAVHKINNADEFVDAFAREDGSGGKAETP